MNDANIAVYALNLKAAKPTVTEPSVTTIQSDSQK